MRVGAPGSQPVGVLIPPNQGSGRGRVNCQLVSNPGGSARRSWILAPWRWRWASLKRRTSSSCRRRCRASGTGSTHSVSLPSTTSTKAWRPYSRSRSRVGVNVRTEAITLRASRSASALKSRSCKYLHRSSRPVGGRTFLLSGSARSFSTSSRTFSWRRTRVEILANTRRVGASWRSVAIYTFRASSFASSRSIWPSMPRLVASSRRRSRLTPKPTASRALSGFSISGQRAL